MSSEFGELKISNDKVDFNSLKIYEKALEGVDLTCERRSLREIEQATLIAGLITSLTR
jgi:hypothetical protein